MRLALSILILATGCLEGGETAALNPSGDGVVDPGTTDSGEADLEPVFGWASEIRYMNRFEEPCHFTEARRKERSDKWQFPIGSRWVLYSSTGEDSYVRSGIDLEWDLDDEGWLDFPLCSSDYQTSKTWKAVIWTPNVEGGGEVVERSVNIEAGAPCADLVFEVPNDVIGSADFVTDLGDGTLHYEEEASQFHIEEVYPDSVFEERDLIRVEMTPRICVEGDHTEWNYRFRWEQIEQL